MKEYCTIRVNGDPKPQPRPRAFARNMGGGKFAARVYDAGTAEGWKGQIALAAKSHLPATPLEMPLMVSLYFFLARPKSHYTGKGNLKPSSPSQPVNKMDCDNLAKSVLDALTQLGMWRDDGQITQLVISKSFTTSAAGVTIIITPLE
jgi:Holliday junction resolvase RusA-like endonuclease